MSWVKLEKPLAPKKPVGAKLTLTVGKTKSRLTVSLPNPSCGARGWDGFDRADVFFGADELAGMMMIRPCAEGFAKFKRWREAIVLSVPEQKGWPNASQGLGVVPIEFDGADCIIALPQVLLGALRSSSATGMALVANAKKCGAPDGLDIAGTVISLNHRYANLTASELKIFNLMYKRWGDVAYKAAIINALYGDDPNGGPDTAQKGLDVAIFKLRKKLSPLGINIITHIAAGWSLALSPEAT